MTAKGKRAAAPAASPKAKAAASAAKKPQPHLGAWEAIGCDFTLQRVADREPST